MTKQDAYYNNDSDQYFLRYSLNQVTLEGAKFTNLKVNQKIIDVWKNNMVFELLTKERHLKIGLIMKI